MAPASGPRRESGVQRKGSGATTAAAVPGPPAIQSQAAQEDQLLSSCPSSLWLCSYYFD